MDTTKMLGTIQFDEFGYLPDGEYLGTWSEICERFGIGERRTWLLEGLQLLVNDLRAARVRDVWLDGSFVTDDPDPRDYDVCWSPTGANKDTLPREFGYEQEASVDPNIPNHELLVQKYRGDVFVHLPPWADFVSRFRQDREGRSRGIVKIDMDSLE